MNMTTYLLQTVMIGCIFCGDFMCKQSVFWYLKDMHEFFSDSKLKGTEYSSTFYWLLED